MTADAKTPTNWFAQGGRAYARFRPEYPPALAGFLAGLAPSCNRAVDVGCGNGQLALRLAAHFGEVVGVDPSEEQIAHAPAGDGVCYLRGAAERLPLPDRSAGLIAAAQVAVLGPRLTARRYRRRRRRCHVAGRRGEDIDASPEAAGRA